MEILIGTLLGFLSGLGTGGGSLLILYLTLARDLPQGEARLINLLFFLPSAVIACLFRIHKGDLKLKKVFPAIATGCFTAAIFSISSQKWDIQFLKTSFGLLLLITGIRELLYRPKK
jgi:uncharacterized membrane protein YfcA